MLPVIEKGYQSDYLLVTSALAFGQIDKAILKIAQRLKESVEDYSLGASIGKRVKKLCHAVDLRVTEAAIFHSLYFRESKRLAIISGAGIAGLAASFELRARGFSVVIAEKRKSFSRFNIINLNVEAQVFLKKFKLLEEFERVAAAKIKEHRYVVIEKTKQARALGVSDVSNLQLDDSVSFESENFDKLFNQDGIYSVPIRVLQTFLAENALEIGVNILGDASVRVLSRSQTRGVSKVQVTADRILRPDLFFIAEGAKSTTAFHLGMKTKLVVNACSGESWVFGNMTYPGQETFVVSLIDTSEKTLQIANVIFNAKSRVINVAVTADEKVDLSSIRAHILQTVSQVFKQRAFPIEKMNCILSDTVDKPVNIVNQTVVPFSVGNVFCIGDTAGSSSPLAGLGGTLGLTLVPSTVRQLLSDYEQHPDRMHENFDKSSEAYTRRWMQKSAGIKSFCQSVSDKRE